MAYQDAREKFGYQRHPPQSWASFNKGSSFIWKFDKLEDCVRWIWNSSLIEFQMSVEARGRIILRYTGEAFGILISDLLSDNRDAVLSNSRFIAIVIMKKAGIRYNQIAAIMERDHTTIGCALRKFGKLTEGLTDEQIIQQSIDPQRFASHGQLS